jgi:hypothetical protein
LTASSIDRVMSLWRRYRDWWKALERQRPGVAALWRVAGVVTGFFLGALLTHSLDVWVLVIAVLVTTIAAGWTSLRRDPPRGHTD